MTRTTCAALTACLFLFASGCGGGMAAPSDPNEAKTLLVTALDAWKQGEKPNTKPTIRITDLDWSNGSVLESYELQGEGQRLGQDVQQTVAIQLKTPKGKPVKKTVNYVVTTGSTPLIMRQDIDE